VELTVLGLATDYCVKFTVLDALALGYAVNVITDGCRGVNLQPQDSSQAFMEMAARARSIPLMTGGNPRLILHRRFRAGSSSAASLSSIN
jgi:nicotinamidase-related amidase